MNAPSTVSYKYEVMTIYRGEESWAGNAVRMATKEEADAAGHELLTRWYVPESYRVVPSDDPVNYRFVNGRPLRIEEDLP